MFETFGKIRNHMIFGAVGCFALGLALLLVPDVFLKIACYVIGALLIAWGVLGILGCVRDRAVRLGTLFLSVVAAGTGIFVISQPETISSILPIVAGLILLLDGLVNIRHGIGLRRFGDSAGISVLIMGIITVAFGAIIFFNPYSTAEWTLRIIGLGLVYSGLSDFVIIFRMNRANRTYQNQKIIDVEAHPVDDEE